MLARPFAIPLVLALVLLGVGSALEKTAHHRLVVVVCGDGGGGAFLSGDLHTDALGHVHELVRVAAWLQPAPYSLAA